MVYEINLLFLYRYYKIKAIRNKGKVVFDNVRVLVHSGDKGSSIETLG